MAPKDGCRGGRYASESHDGTVEGKASPIAKGSCCCSTCGPRRRPRAVYYDVDVDGFSPNVPGMNSKSIQTWYAKRELRADQSNFVIDRKRETAARVGKWIARRARNYRCG